MARGEQALDITHHAVYAVHVEPVHEVPCLFKGRGKVKAEDFKFAIRKDEVATGRVKELLAMDKSLKDARQQFDTEEGRLMFLLRWA